MPSLFPVTNNNNDDDHDDNLYFNTVKTHQDYILDEKQKKKLQYLSVNIYKREHIFLREMKIKGTCFQECRTLKVRHQFK